MKLNYEKINSNSNYDYIYESNDSVQISNTLKNNKKWYIFNIILFYLLVVSILVLQGIMFYYFLEFGTFLDKLNKINVSEVDDYINKTKVIVDYVCNNLIEC